MEIVKSRLEDYEIEIVTKQLNSLQVLRNSIQSESLALGIVNIKGLTLLKNKRLVDIKVSNDGIPTFKQLNIYSPILGQKYPEIPHSSKARWSLSFQTKDLQQEEKVILDIFAVYSDDTTEAIACVYLTKINLTKILTEEVISKLILIHPTPLFYKPLNLTLFFSGKSGSTFGLKWFFYQINFLEAASFYNDWPHKFREDFFYKSQSYMDDIKSVIDSDVVCLTRNPFIRAVSSYAHAIKFDYEHSKLEKFLNRKINLEHTFTFREFVFYLESINIRQCNLHHQLQIHPLMQYGFLKKIYLVHLENSGKEFREIEKKLNLKHAPLKKFQESLHSHYKKEANLQGLFTDQQLKKEDAFPNYKSFYDDSLVEKIYKIYRDDFDAFDYPKTLTV